MKLRQKFSEFKNFMQLFCLPLTIDSSTAGKGSDMNSRIKRRRIGPKDGSESEEEDHEQLNGASFDEESDVVEDFSEEKRGEAEENQESTEEAATDEESDDENDAIQQGVIAYTSPISY